MKAVIGLFDNDEQVQASIERLKQAGFTEKQIKPVTCTTPLCKLLNKYCQCHMVNNWVAFGALFGLVHAGVLAFFISLLANRLFTLSPLVWFLLFVGLTLFGTFLGAIFGFVFGRDQWEAEQQMYLHGVDAGQRVVAVQVTDEVMAAKARLWLQDAEAQGIETLDHLPETALVSVLSNMKGAAPVSALS